MTMNMEDPLHIHNVRECGSEILGDNRYRMGPLYCWRSRVTTQPECLNASICSPISYTSARDTFCRYFGGNKDPRMPGDTTCVPDQFVGPLPGEDPYTANIRGGTVTYERMCEGPGGKLRCLGEGLSQSIRSQPPGQFLIHIGLALGGLLVVALIIRYTGVGKSLRKIKIFDTRALKPHGKSSRKDR